jgi:hypothetical protein
MPRLKWFSFTISRRVLDGRRQVGLVPRWKQDTTNYLKALMNDASWHMKVQFNICCPLYSPRSKGVEESLYMGYSTPDTVIFAVCNGPDRDTFQLDGLDVKFLRVTGKPIREDSNTHFYLAGKKTLDG